ncbi:MAG: alginate lyase family protein, partial [Bacteroidota bacterium]
TAREKRIAVHLAPDGSQPHELKRTKSLSYSTMNLRALTRLAYHGKRLGVDLWNYRPEDGGSLPDAYAYLRPFAFTDKPWPYPQLGSIAKVMDGTRRLFFETGATLGLNAYCQEIDNADLPPAHRYHLLYVCPNS